MAEPAGTRSGPPESPWQVSTPPCGNPAATCVSLSKPPNRGSTPSTRYGYASAASSSATIGTRASWRTSGCSPPDSVTPKPAIVASVPAVHSERSAADATFTAALDEGVSSSMIAASWLTLPRPAQPGLTNTALATCFSPSDW